jgi:hypothetical protein
MCKKHKTHGRFRNRGSEYQILFQYLSDHGAQSEGAPAAHRYAMEACSNNGFGHGPVHFGVDMTGIEDGSQCSAWVVLAAGTAKAWIPR